MRSMLGHLVVVAAAGLVGGCSDAVLGHQSASSNTGGAGGSGSTTSTFPVTGVTTGSSGGAGGTGASCPPDMLGAYTGVWGELEGMPYKFCPKTAFDDTDTEQDGFAVLESSDQSQVALLLMKVTKTDDGHFSDLGVVRLPKQSPFPETWFCGPGSRVTSLLADSHFGLADEFAPLTKLGACLDGAPVDGTIVGAVSPNMEPPFSSVTSTIEGASFDQSSVVASEQSWGSQTLTQIDGQACLITIGPSGLAFALLSPSANEKGTLYCASSAQLTNGTLTMGGFRRLGSCDTASNVSGSLTAARTYLQDD